MRRADGTLARFVVRQVQEYDKRDFPTQVVYEGNGDASLRLITCGGEFDRRSKRYLSNTIVFASLYRAPAKKKPVVTKPASKQPTAKQPTAKQPPARPTGFFTVSF